MDDASIYKRMILLTRVLHSQLRMLPAHKVYKASKVRVRGLGVRGLGVHS